MSQEAINALRYIFTFAELEASIARQQGDHSQAARDYRDSDRHNSYARAMEKVRAKAVVYAREEFLADLSSAPMTESNEETK